MDKNTYTIFTAKIDEVTKKLNRIAKKAEKYNVPFSFSFGEPYAYVSTTKNDDGTISENTYEVADLTIESEIIKNGDYTVVAHLEHSSTGNIVNVFEGEMQKEWATVEPFCVHCNSNHNLRYTFMVSNGEEVKQVGRNCLMDYCGINPQFIGMMNQFFEDLEEDTVDGYDYTEPLECVFNSTQVLALAIEAVNEQGYVKSDEPNSNKHMINKNVGCHRASYEIEKEAEHMSKAIEEMSIDEAIDAKLNNVQARIKGGYCKPSDFGYFAYAPVAYERYLKRKEMQKRKEEERNAMSAQSEYVGTVGERSEFSVKEAKLLTSFFTDYGTTFLYRFIDENDNVLIWFASSQLENMEMKKIKATIKAHNEREGVKQTILTRVKVA